jgi:hypothetical protein
MLRTSPPGASVLDETGQELGQTPWQIEHPLGSGEQVVTIRKSGFIDLKVSFAKDRDVERSEALVAVRPPPPEPRPPTPKRPAVSKGRKNDSLILDFKTHKKLN